MGAGPTISLVKLSVWMVAVVLSFTPFSTADESLGDAAKREKERRKRLEEAGPKAPVIGQDDVRTGKVTADKPGTTDSSKASASGKEPAKPAAPSVSEEQAWRAKADAARARVAAAERAVEAAAGELARSWTDDACPMGMTACLDLEGLRGAQARSDAAKVELEAAKRALVDLEEEARRAGAQPGWIR
jgi:hypothetical protein